MFRKDIPTQSTLRPQDGLSASTQTVFLTLLILAITECWSRPRSFSRILICWLEVIFFRDYVKCPVCNDELTHKHKGKTVFSDRERYESLRHVKWVDEVVEDAPWVLTEDFLAKHKVPSA
jgi:hypothetical protein